MLGMLNTIRCTRLVQRLHTSTGYLLHRVPLLQNVM